MASAAMIKIKMSAAHILGRDMRGRDMLARPVFIASL
jgi:ABC-type dipeptide/oligopeptide/nickel transport system permease subunit